MDTAGVITAVVALIGLNISILKTVLDIKGNCAARGMYCERRFCRLEAASNVPSIVPAE